MTLNFPLILIALSCAAMIVFIYRGGRTRGSFPRSISGRDKSSWTIDREQHDIEFPLLQPSDISPPERAVIWATQIPALRFVRDREPRGSYYTPLKLIYFGLANRYPEIYDGSTFQRWVEFYVRTGIFRFEDDAIHLTRRGHGLLEFLDDARLRETALR